MKKLPDKQDEILLFINGWIDDHGVSPTLGDIVAHGVVTYRESASKIIKRLKEKGFLHDKPIQVRRDLVVSHSEERRLFCY